MLFVGKCGVIVGKFKNKDKKTTAFGSSPFFFSQPYKSKLLRECKITHPANAGFVIFIGVNSKDKKVSFQSGFIVS